MSILNLLKKECWDGSQTWLWSDCPPKTPIVEEPPMNTPDPVVPTTPTDPVVPTDPVADVQAFKGFDIGIQETCGAYSGTRPSVSVGSNGSICMITDQGTSNTLWYFTKIAGKWTSGIFAKGEKGGKYNASRLYMPHIEIDSKGRAWISTKFGCKEYGTMLGQGLWMIGDISKFIPTMFRWVKILKLTRAMVM